MIKLFSPLEQFSVVSFENFSLNLDTVLSITPTNISIVTCIHLGLMIAISHSITKTPIISTTKLNNVIICSAQIRLMLCESNYLCNFFVTGFISVVWILLMFNVSGLIPFTFTITTHIIITFTSATILFFWMNSVFFLRFLIEWGGIFLPAGTPNFILFLIVPIEIISYFSRIFSLSIRLFANMMSGHTLLVILIGFIYGGFTVNMIFIFPIIIINLIFLLDIGVAFLQVYVFLTLVGLYLNDTNFWQH